MAVVKHCIERTCTAANPAMGRGCVLELIMYGVSPYNKEPFEGQIMTAAVPNRTTRVEARIAPEGLDVVRRAAEIQGRSVSDFMVVSALDAAHRTIEDAQIIRLSVNDQQRFAQALLDPPALPPAMIRAALAHKKLIAAKK